MNPPPPETDVKILCRKRPIQFGIAFEVQHTVSDDLKTGFTELRAVLYFWRWLGWHNFKLSEKPELP